MAILKRGYAMLIRGGDAEISGALASGIMAVRGDPSVTAYGPRHLPCKGRLGEAKPLETDQIQVVKTDLDIQRAADLLRVAMHPEPVDYAGKVFDAEMAYGESLYEPSVLKRMADRITFGVAVVVMAFEAFTRWEERKWRN